MTLTCDQCARPAMAWQPGTAEVRELFLLQREEPVRAWCWMCWCRQFAQEVAA